MLLPQDEKYLRAKGWRYEVTPDGGFLCLVIHDYEPPPGYDQAKTDLLVRLAQGYPDAALDMFWFDPPTWLTRLVEVNGGDNVVPPCEHDVLHAAGIQAAWVPSAGSTRKRGQRHGAGSNGVRRSPVIKAECGQVDP